MTRLFRDAHSLNLKRPALSKDPENNSTIQDYTAPAVDRTIKGMFQQRGGELVQDEEGNSLPIDAIFYTSDTDIAVDDVLTVSLTGTDDKFRVISREAKYDVDGVFTHLQCNLIVETRF